MTRNRTLLYPPRNQPTCAGELGNIARVFRLSKKLSSGDGTGPACFVLRAANTVVLSWAKQKAPKQVRLPCFGASLALAHWGEGAEHFRGIFASRNRNGGKMTRRSLRQPDFERWTGKARPPVIRPIQNECPSIGHCDSSCVG